MKGIVFDTASVRSIDENGYMHVALTNISKACVNPYLGEEIGDCEKLGLDPKGIYYALRAPEELEKAAPTFNGLPLLLDHHLMDAEIQPKEFIVGSTGTDATFDGVYLKNSLSITDQKAIAAIEDGSAKEISCAYSYDPEWTAGEFGEEKIHYDFIMRNIKGNHVALVAEGRAGHDVKVADGKPDGIKSKEDILEKAELKRRVAAYLASDGDIPEAVEQALEQIEQAVELPVVAVVPEGAVEGSVTDEELAEKMKDPAFKDAFEAGMKYAQEHADNKDLLPPTAEGEDPETNDGEGEENPATDDGEGEEAPANDDGEGEAGDCGGKAGDCGGKASDAIAKIKAKAKEEAFAEFLKLNDAARKVRPLVGEIKNLKSLDSAEKIYGFALKQVGQDIKKYPPAAYEAMVDMMIKQSKANDAGIQQQNDKLDEIMKRLNKIH